MAVEEQVDLGRRGGRRDVDQADAQAGPGEVQGEGPIGDGIAIAADYLQRLAGGAQFVEDPFAADIAQVPDLVSGGNPFDKLVGEFVVRVGEDGDLGERIMNYEL